jgi:hypothetical protein
VMPERGAEIQTWVTEENGADKVNYHNTVWGVQALIGITDQLELALPVDLIWRDSDAINPGFTWQSYGVEARYRFVSQDPVDAPPFAPLVRVAVKRDVSFQVYGDFRLGAEVFGHISVDESADRWVAAGPNLAWSHGRSWVSAAMGIGIYQIKTAPALQWGIMF